MITQIKEMKILATDEYARKQRKSLHLCLQCGTQDERTLAGKTCCAFCSKRQKLLYREKCKEFYEKKKAITERLRKDNENFKK